MQELEKILEEIKIDRGNINTPPGGDADKIIRMCYKRVEKIIRNHMNDGWILVEERLPEDDGAVLVSYVDVDDEQYADIAIATYGYAYLGSNKMDFKEWRSPFRRFRINYKVIAWRPLPEPYRPERSEE